MLAIWSKPKFCHLVKELRLGLTAHGNNVGSHLTLYYTIQSFKGGYLDFSHLTELSNLYITEIYMTKQYKSYIIKNHKIAEKIFVDGVPLKSYVAS